jgi:hypothetical protein
VAIWGTIAIMTSAPIDDWWHQAYGADASAWSPPHAVLTLGIAGVIIGSLLLMVSAANRGSRRRQRRLRAPLAASPLRER